MYVKACQRPFFATEMPTAIKRHERVLVPSAGVYVISFFRARREESSAIAHRFKTHSTLAWYYCLSSKPASFKFCVLFSIFSRCTRQSLPLSRT